jgi:hypothetical protein
MSVGVMTVGEITVGVMTVGVMRRPRIYNVMLMRFQPFNLHCNDFQILLLFNFLSFV